jgi:PUB domain
VNQIITKRREEKERIEKEEARLREIKRRQEGQATQEMADDIAALQRKREAEKIKHDMEVKASETKRLKIELARDKIERWQKLHPGEQVPTDMMESLQILLGTKSASTTSTSDTSSSTTSSSVTIEQNIQTAIKAISAYKAGIGATCAQTIRTLCFNALSNPNESKFRSVNLANPKIKERLSTIRGGLFAMTCAGWVKDDTTQTLVLNDTSYDVSKLKLVVDSLDKAIADHLFD